MPSPHPALAEADLHARALDLATHVLDHWSEHPPTPRDVARQAPGDPAIPFLCRLVSATPDPAARASASAARASAARAAAHVSAARASAARAAAVWARTAGKGPHHPGLFNGGLTGTLMGLQHATHLHPALAAPATRLRTRLLTHPRPGHHGHVTFPDYDLITGPAGLLLALADDDTLDPRALLPLIQHLSDLCGSDTLAGLRAHYPGHPQLGWLHGQINTGMGHGAAGVMTALAAAVRRLHRHDPTTVPDHARSALGHLQHWFRQEAFDDQRSLRTWDGAGPRPHPAIPGARARQAWCYGTPGIAWALWETATVLGDTGAATWAGHAFTTLADAYDTDHHLYGDHIGDHLGLCHGAAGVLLIADAFHRHAHHPAAPALRTRLLTYLATHDEDLHTPAPRPTSLLSSVYGVLAALLTTTGGDRSWLACLGLR
ncbi:lanthionine synthetase LanC family protein [Streptomyces sp. NPDC055025]